MEISGLSFSLNEGFEKPMLHILVTNELIFNDISVYASIYSYNLFMFTSLSHFIDLVFLDVVNDLCLSLDYKDALLINYSVKYAFLLLLITVYCQWSGHHGKNQTIHPIDCSFNSF